MSKDTTKPAIWTLDGFFCPTCDHWFDDDGADAPDECPKCGQKMSGWVDGRERND